VSVGLGQKFFQNLCRSVGSGPRIFFFVFLSQVLLCGGLES
jgi:hypothetical protein